MTAAASMAAIRRELASLGFPKGVPASIKLMALSSQDFKSSRLGYGHGTYPDRAHLLFLAHQESEHT
ncbi:unannotated protein [freshwater metagenome]|uniref:Unannotated protein n=1 Tax=freshwater metagenome TaxID=449393 RepID=A0A6J7TP71_9ZZZZ